MDKKYWAMQTTIFQGKDKNVVKGRMQKVLILMDREGGAKHKTIQIDYGSIHQGDNYRGRLNIWEWYYTSDWPETNI